MLGSILELSFNPCCAGCSSGSSFIFNPLYDCYYLSILVVLDVVLEDLYGEVNLGITCNFQSLLCWM